LFIHLIESINFLNFIYHGIRKSSFPEDTYARCHNDFIKFYNRFILDRIWRQCDGESTGTCELKASQKHNANVFKKQMDFLFNRYFSDQPCTKRYSGNNIDNRFCFDSGIMQLESAVGVIYGANIGTTVTAQLMSLNISQYAWYILIAGSILSFGPIKKLKTVGNVTAGIGLLFSGLNILSRSVVFIRENVLLVQWLQSHSNNLLLCLFTGLIVTMLVQSSSATVGLTILLFNSGLMPFSSAVVLTLGDNIGSCITAQIASLRSGTAGKRTAWAHTIYNIIGVVFALIILPQFCTIVQFCTHLAGQDNNRLVANTHTIFNILSAMIFLPFSKYYVKFLEFIIPERRKIRQRNQIKKDRIIINRLRLPVRKQKRG
jgi:phosphate:Na+ symporter